MKSRSPNQRPAALVVVLVLLNLLPAMPAFSDELTPKNERIDAVAITNVDATFIQSDGSCVLASYAIVANYFTRRPVSDFFDGYCHHFGLAYSDHVDAERKYARHFDAEWKMRKCMGYEVILDLHSNSTERCFVEARQLFDARFFLESSKHVDELEQALNTREAFLNITYEPGGDYHSITVMYDGTRLMARDTNRKGLYPLASLRSIGKLRDGVLFVRK